MYYNRRFTAIHQSLTLLIWQMFRSKNKNYHQILNHRAHLTKRSNNISSHHFFFLLVFSTVKTYVPSRCVYVLLMCGFNEFSIVIWTSGTWPVLSNTTLHALKKTLRSIYHSLEKQTHFCIWNEEAKDINFSNRVDETIFHHIGKNTEGVVMNLFEYKLRVSMDLVVKRFIQMLLTRSVNHPQQKDEQKWKFQ